MGGGQARQVSTATAIDPGPTRQQIAEFYERHGVVVVDGQILMPRDGRDDALNELEERWGLFTIPELPKAKAKRANDGSPRLSWRYAPLPLAILDDSHLKPMAKVVG